MIIRPSHRADAGWLIWIAAMTGADARNASSSTPSSAKPPAKSNWFPVPAPVQRVFDRFPLVVYAENGLPQRAPGRRDLATLYMFTTPASAHDGSPSFNPACLKWQAYLRFHRINFKTIPSNNHASPTGALPFVIPPATSQPSSREPIPWSKILKWATAQSGYPESLHDMRYDAYSSLLDHRVRNAWLFTLYIDNSNFTSVAKRLYIDPTTSSTLVRLALMHQLKNAARDELLKYSSIIDEDDLYADAEQAFQALSTLLGDNEHFFGTDRPGLFDAGVFAYTHLLLDINMGWTVTRMADGLRRFENLVQHRQRIFSTYFGG
jgi:metaxin